MGAQVINLWRRDVDQSGTTSTIIMVNQSVTGPRGADGAGVSVATKESGTEKVAVTTVLDFLAGFDVAGAAGVASVSVDLTEYSGGALPVAGGGTGATDASGARTNQGLGTAATTAATAYATAAQGTKADTAVQPARTISTTAPLTGGGDLSANRTLAVSAATDSAAGVVELATDAETVTGTDTTRATTPAGVAAAIAAGGGGGGGGIGGVPTFSPITKVGKWNRSFVGEGHAAGVAPLSNLNRLIWSPCFLSESITIDRLAISMQSPGSSGAVLRIGAWESNSDGWPGDLIVDAGTVAADSGGIKEATVSAVLPAGLIWFGLVPQVATCSVHGYTDTVRPFMWTDTAVAYANPKLFGRDSISGALPDPASPAFYTTTDPYAEVVFMFRRSA